MKTILKQNEPTFNPFTIEITFETLQEASLIAKVMKANLRIPELLTNDGDIKVQETEILVNLMDEINTQMQRGIK